MNTLDGRSQGGCRARRESEQRKDERELELQLRGVVAGKRRSVRQQGDCGREVGDGFLIGRQPERPLTGEPQGPRWPWEGLGPFEVPGEPCGDLAGAVAVERLERAADPLVQVGPLRFVQAAQPGTAAVTTCSNR